MKKRVFITYFAIAFGGLFYTFPSSFAGTTCERIGNKTYCDGGYGQPSYTIEKIGNKHYIDGGYGGQSSVCEQIGSKMYCD
tara:strand:- start:297 stop:539 length:243 start_codon:yes stop_codon:yes gene_type:complete